MTQEQLERRRQEMNNDPEDFFIKHKDELNDVQEALENHPKFKNLHGHELVANIHKAIDDAQVQIKFADVMQCGKQECSFCCHSEIYIGQAEAAYIKKYAKYEIDPKRLALQRATTDYTKLSFAEKACIMLKDGKCQVYNHRPALCRNHGVVAGTDPEECHQQNLYQHVPGKAVAVQQPRAVLLEGLTMFVTLKDARSLADVRNIAQYDW